MSMRELDRLKVIQDVVDGKLQPWRAANRLELTTRQIRRLAARFREHGPAGLVSGHRAKPGNRRLDGDYVDDATSRLLTLHFTAAELVVSDASALNGD